MSSCIQNTIGSISTQEMKISANVSIDAPPILHTATRIKTMQSSPGHILTQPGPGSRYQLTDHLRHQIIQTAKI